MPTENREIEPGWVCRSDNLGVVFVAKDHGSDSLTAYTASGSRWGVSRKSLRPVAPLEELSYLHHLVDRLEAWLEGKTMTLEQSEFAHEILERLGRLP